MDVYTGTMMKHRSGNQGGGAQMGAPALFFGDFIVCCTSAHQRAEHILKNLGGESYGKAGFL